MKRIACWYLARSIGAREFDVFLPTGCDVILECFLLHSGVSMDIVHTNLLYLIKLAIPLYGIIALILKVSWRYRILYSTLSGIIFPDLSDWNRLLLVAVPSVFYYKVWRVLRQKGEDGC